MQVNETLSEGLKREFTIIVPSSDVEAEVEGRLLELSKTIKMKGFRPGKVPLAIVRRQYRPSVLGEVLERSIQKSSQKAIEERELRPALQPKIEITDYGDGKDLEYKMDMEILPDIEIGNLSEISLTRLVSEADDEKVNESLKRIAEADKQFKPAEEGRVAVSGDGLLIDFKGKIDGVDLEGTSADDFEIELGSGTFIPGFEEQLIGVKKGEHRQVNVEFPADYPQEDAAGKAALFEVDVKEVRERTETTIDDEMAKRQGVDDLAALTGLVREQLEQQFEAASKAQLKRSLLDDLAERYTFEVPAGMVDQEFETIWTQITRDLEKSKSTFEESMDQSEDEARAEYRQIAERRVRLGLLLSEIGRENEISIERDDLLKAALESARGFSNPQQVLEFYRSNPNALERFRAPVFEDKVVAFLSELADIKESVVDPEELFRDPDDVAGTEKSAKGSSKKSGTPAAKKKAVKKPASKAEATDAKVTTKNTAAKRKTTSDKSGQKTAKSTTAAAKEK
ncbi:MAG: trigger factor [Proteobacteria bacterium]|nr:trigger factor [Pseudomonadota bacterium]MDA1355914.1 trigger factor [Pseudomonadota bacterium]